MYQDTTQPACTLAAVHRQACRTSHSVMHISTMKSRSAKLFLALLLPTAADGSLRVIGAGMGRTGTDSLRNALDILGVGPTYHMIELLGISDTQTRPVSPLEMLGFAKGHNDLWAELNRNITLGVKPDFSFIAKDYNSAVDFPSAAFWPELLEAYPNAKVVLTVRDPVSLHRSINAAWCRLIGGGSALDRIVAQISFARPFGMRNHRMHEAMAEGTARLVGKPGFTWQRACDDETYAIDAFKAWDAKVRATVPAKQLLVFETGKHGFKELAEFLGVPEPAEPYPRTNSSAEFGAVIGIFRFLAVLTVGVPTALMWCALRRMGRKGKAKSS